MARPIKYNVEYFPHYISTGKKMSVMQSRYGNNGYAVWFKILEQLGDTDFHYLDLNNDLDFHYLANNICLVSEEILIKILDDLAEFGEINADLWSAKIVWSEKFMNSISDAYKRRESKTMTLEGLCSHILNTKPKLKELLYTIIPIKPILAGLMYTETELLYTESTERDRDRDRDIIGIEEGNEKNTKTPVPDDPELKNSSIPKPDAWGAYKSMDELEIVLLSHQGWQADFGKSLGIDNPENVPKWITKFFIFCKGNGKVHAKESEAKSHCHSWTRRQIELGKDVNDGYSPKPSDVSNPSTPPDNSGKWAWLNNGWRDTSTFTPAQKRRNGLA
ncbi:Lin1244/Lin1753 domain-containing protein [Sphingobacterium hungaricum]|uniref:Lin1244/Lin1753-like N-terminal domain-containing protein n=1 Tax=Sphingobacterium hungaricum TaxID=2082723 RepID=A0A928UTG6_9SPHI|nr:Lin1244/Lin1753 domain-containing protein [Sphingobacterium hungaricum]MBE8712553.1 hypothetical protein [Sphingobacterium hungaricum]